MKKRGFLTYEEAKRWADFVYWCGAGVYKYGIDGKKTLVKDERVLISGVDYVDWHGEGKFDWKNDGVQCKGEIVK